jgi:hypothetical protein
MTNWEHHFNSVAVSTPVTGCERCQPRPPIKDHPDMSPAATPHNLGDAIKAICGYDSSVASSKTIDVIQEKVHMELTVGISWMGSNWMVIRRRGSSMPLAQLRKYGHTDAAMRIASDPFSSHDTSRIRRRIRKPAYALCSVERQSVRPRESFLFAVRSRCVACREWVMLYDCIFET